MFIMSKEYEVVQAHPEGEVQIAGKQASEIVTSLDTFAGKIHVKWAPEAAVSSLGLMPFFIEFLKTSGLFDKWVEDCPLHYTSGNAPEKRDVLGTLVLSVLAGHWRYAHINAIRADGINPELLGMTGVASEDSVRRGMKAMDEAASGEWMKRHLKATYEPLLEEPWVLDVDTTVKPLYGHQQDAKVGYNPTKPGRPSHAYHSYFVANIRMVLDMEVQAGIRRLRCMRNRNCGHFWTDYRSRTGQCSCAGTAIGERRKPWLEPRSEGWDTCSNSSRARM